MIPATKAIAQNFEHVHSDTTPLTGLATTIRDWSDKAAERPSVERGPSNEEEEDDDDEAAAFASFEILLIHF